jgi:hypothetical protein
VSRHQRSDFDEADVGTYQKTLDALVRVESVLAARLGLGESTGSRWGTSERKPTVSEKARPYYLTYVIEPHPEGISREQVGVRGACDSAVFIGVRNRDDGSSSTAIAACDGRAGKDLDALEIFKAWGVLTHVLANHEQLSPAKRAFCSDVFERLRNALLEGRGPGQN